MEEDQLRIDIIREVSGCSYDPNMRDYYVNAIVEIIHYLDSPYKIFQFKSGSDTILIIGIQLKIPYSGNKYDIPIQIHMVSGIPRVPPQFYIVLESGITINQLNKDINPENFRITSVSLKSWNQSIRIKAVIDEIIKSFSTNFPLYKKKEPLSNNSSIYCQSMNNSRMYQQPSIRPCGPGGMAGLSGYIQNTINPQYNPQRQGQPQLGYNNSSYNPIQQIGNQPMNPQQAQESLRQILLNEVQMKLDAKFREETRKLIKQKNCLNNYKNQFSIEDDKMTQYLNNKENIQQEGLKKLNEIDWEIQNIQSYIAQNQSKALTSTTCKDFVSIANEKSNMIISLIAKEAMYEEMLAYIKKGFEKESIDFNEALKGIRSFSRDLFMTKYQREKYASDSLSMMY